MFGIMFTNSLCGMVTSKIVILEYCTLDKFICSVDQQVKSIYHIINFEVCASSFEKNIFAIQPPLPKEICFAEWTHSILFFMV